MRKLELKDIVGYLPYRLQGLCRGEVIPFIISTHYNCDLVVEHCLNSMSDIKPLLRPISDLTKPIVVKGYNDDKAFVPIVALAETAYKEVFDGYVTNESVLKEIEPNPKSDGSYMIDNFSFKDGMFEMLDYGEVIKRNKKDEEPFVEIVHTPLNQCNYYDLLDQWHFDYRNLIGEGLAIDINTLNQTDKIWK